MGVVFPTWTHKLIPHPFRTIVGSVHSRSKERNQIRKTKRPNITLTLTCIHLSSVVPEHLVALCTYLDPCISNSGHHKVSLRMRTFRTRQCHTTRHQTNLRTWFDGYFRVHARELALLDLLFGHYSSHHRWRVLRDQSQIFSHNRHFRPRHCAQRDPDGQCVDFEGMPCPERDVMLNHG